MAIRRRQLDLVEQNDQFSRWKRGSHAYHFEIREIVKENWKKDVEEKKSIPLGYFNFLFIHNNNLNYLYYQYNQLYKFQ